MLRDCAVFSVANQDTLGIFVELGRTVIKGTTVAHLHKTREAKVRINMVKAIITDLPLDDKLVRMSKGRSFILFVGGGMHMVSIGPNSWL
jgi:hypothetical protein